MAINIVDNFFTNTALPIDGKYYTIGGLPWPSPTIAKSGILSGQRYQGLTIAIEDGTSIKEYWWKNGITDNDLIEKISGIGTTINTDTTININSNTFCIKDAGTTCSPVSPTGFCITPGCDAKTSDLNWNLNINTFDGKNVFNNFSWFKQNVGIGSRPQPTTSNIVTNNSALFVTKNTSFTSVNPITVTTESVLSFGGSSAEGATSIYSGIFGALVWTPNQNYNSPALSPGVTYAGVSGYLQLTSSTITDGAQLSATSSQVYTGANSSILLTGVSSSGSTVTVPAGTNFANIQPGYQITIKSGGTFTVKNVYVNTINPGTNSFTIQKITGGTYGSFTYSAEVPSTPLSNATVVIAKASGGNHLGVVENVMGLRVLPPSPDRYAGSSVRIKNLTGLRIEDIASSVPGPSNPWNPSSPSAVFAPGYVDSTYGIRQMGEKDKNYLAGPLIIPKAYDVDGGICDAGNKSMGVAKFVNGVVRVNTKAAINDQCMVFVSLMLPSGTAGVPYVQDSQVNDGHFFINSTAGATDQSFVNWWIIANVEY